MTTYTPTRKMTAVGLGGAISVILIWLLETYVLPDPIPAQVAAAVSLIISFICGYWTTDKED